jgi:uncharacterized protein YbjT (DUF2867 family)
MTNTILVLGATGNIGSQVVKQLAAAGANTRAAVRSVSKADAIKGAGVSLVEIDMNKPETFQAAFEEVEKVFLLTPPFPNMAELTGNLVSAAKKAQVKHIVKQSGFGTGTEPKATLLGWHREGEKMIEASGIPYTFLRPNSFMQNYSNTSARTIKTQSTFYKPMGDAKVSLVDVRDIAAVAVAALTQSGHEGKAYDITGSEALSNEQIAEILSTVVGRKINYVDISEDAASQGMKAAGMPEVLVDAFMELNRIAKAGNASNVSPVVEQVTGKKPISFEQFARDYADVFN